MKPLYTLLFLLLIINISANKIPTNRISPPITIGEELQDSTITGDSIRINLQAFDYNNQKEADSLLVSIFFKDNSAFPNFEFINILTDANGQMQLTHLPGHYSVQISKPCTPDFKQDFEFSITNPRHSRTITVNITQVVELDPEMLIMEDKPVIYLYSKEKMNLKIGLKPKGSLTFTYPKLNNSWNTVIYPNGDIEIADKKYPYLFWEGKTPFKSIGSKDTGFVVKSEESIEFFEENLSHIGLNQREITDFITYWCPKMTQSKYHIQFHVGSDYDRYIGELLYSTEPDSEIRIYAIIKEYQGEKITLQELPKIERNGFTVVEWGGSIISPNRIKL